MTDNVIPLPNVNIIPAPGVVNPLKSLDDLRALFHNFVAVLVPILVSVHLVDNNAAVLWTALAFAIVDPILSVSNTTDKVRKVIYGLLALLQTGTVATTIIQTAAEHSSPVVAPIITAVGAAITGLFSGLFTPTPTTMQVVSEYPNIEDVA
jgi:hypothetical protein